MAISGITMGSHAPQVFKALVKASAYGARAIIERFGRGRANRRRHDWRYSKPSDFIMQTCADVLEQHRRTGESRALCLAAIYL